MADKQISELQKATSLNGNELLVISQDGKAKNVTVDELGQMMPGGGSPDAVLYTPQTLTEAQKAQARENIGAMAEAAVSVVDGYRIGGYYNTNNGVWVDADGFISTRHVPCTHGSIVKISSTLAYGITPSDIPFFVAYYDADMNHIGQNTNLALTPVENTRMVECTFVVNFENAAYFTFFLSTSYWLPGRPNNDFDGYVYTPINALVPLSNVIGESGEAAGFILYTPQELTEEQKEQARANIGAESVTTGTAIVRTTTTVFESPYFATENAYLNNSGQAASHAHYVTSDFIPAIPGTTIEYTDLRCIAGYSYVIGVYDADKKFLATLGVTDTKSTGGSGVSLSGTYIIPDGVAYFRFSDYADTLGDVTYSREVYITDSTKNNDKQWMGRSWVAFGTSITDTSYTNAESGLVTGKYVPYLAELSGLNVTNCGIAGASIATGGVHGAGGGILTKILSTDVSGADLITIEGFVNDFAADVSLGELGDTENATLCGAIYQAVKYCLENSNATVVLITDSTGREYTLTSSGQTADYTVTRKNSIDKTQNDYNEAIVKMGQFMGVHVIDAGRKAQINEFHPAYLEDHLHHSKLGGKQYAETIWEELKNIHVTSAVEVAT